MQSQSSLYFKLPFDPYRCTSWANFLELYYAYSPS